MLVVHSWKLNVSWARDGILGAVPRRCAALKCSLCFPYPYMPWPLPLLMPVSTSCVASSIPFIWPCVIAARAISFGQNKVSEVRLFRLLSEMASSRTFIQPTVLIQLMYITEKCPSLALQNYNSFVPWWMIMIALLWNNLFTLQKKSYDFTFKFTIHPRISALRTHQNSPIEKFWLL